MQLNHSTLTPKGSSADLLSTALQKRLESLRKVNSQSSLSSSPVQRKQVIANPRRQTLTAINNDHIFERGYSSCTTPVLIDTMNNFFQKAQSMEEEVMLPSRLKDMSVDQVTFDNAVQTDTWHDIYSFVRDMRNQLQCIYPFTDDSNSNDTKEQPGKDSNDDEGIMIANLDNNPCSEASSIASSDEYQQSSTSVSLTSFDTIKDELKHHYYGLFRALDNLSSIAKRVTEKYREEYID